MGKRQEKVWKNQHLFASGGDTYRMGPMAQPLLAAFSLGGAFLIKVTFVGWMSN